MNDYMLEGDYGTLKMPGLCFGITFNEFADGTYDYTYRYNMTARPGGGDGTSDFPLTN